MNVFDATTTAEFLRAWISSRPMKGRGELRRLSRKTGIHTTTMSQVVKGRRLLSLEQAAPLATHLGLSKLETRYFLTLLQRERAGTEALGQYFTAELLEIKNESKELIHLVKRDKTLSEEERSKFYSHWYYAGVAVLASLPSLNTRATISERTGLNRARTDEIVDFLLRAGILIEEKGKLKTGATATHLESASPLVSRHHGNWRIKSMERHPNLSEDELAYSCPVSLSGRDAKKVRALLAKAVKETNAIVGPSECETAYFLNVDWIQI